MKGAAQAPLYPMLLQAMHHQASGSKLTTVISLISQDLDSRRASLHDITSL